MRLPTKRLITIGCLILLAVVVIFLAIQAMLHIGVIASAIAGVFNALRSILIGGVMAYLLYPLARLSEQFLLYHHVKKKSARALSTIFALLVLLVFLAMFAYFIIPQLVVSVPALIQNLPDMIQNFSDQLTSFLSAHGVTTDVLDDLFQRIQNFFTNWINDDPLSTLMDLAGRIKNAARSLLNFVIGIIVMVYLLMGRDQFVGQGKKILFAVVKKRRTCDRILNHLRVINKIFSGFVSGKLLDSLVIGILCGVCLSILRMPYVPLISVIIGVTNIIPVFGPFFGAIPSALLLLLTDPGKCFIFIIFIIVLQQIDGNVIGPKILGDSTGLPAFWVLFSLLLFSHLMGFWGMLLGVPLFASFYYLLREFINSRLRKKKLPVATQEYIHIAAIDDNGAVTYNTLDTIDFPAIFHGEESLWNQFRRKFVNLPDRAEEEAESKAEVQGKEDGDSTLPES